MSNPHLTNLFLHFQNLWTTKKYRGPKSMKMFIEEKFHIIYLLKQLIYLFK